MAHRKYHGALELRLQYRKRRLIWTDLFYLPGCASFLPLLLKPAHQLFSCCGSGPCSAAIVGMKAEAYYLSSSGNVAMCLRLATPKLCYEETETTARDDRNVSYFASVLYLANGVNCAWA